MTARTTDDRGFALVEILAVMLIIGALTTIASTQYTHWKDKTVLTSVRADAKTIGDALIAEHLSGEHAGTPEVVQIGRTIAYNNTKVGTVTEKSTLTGFTVDDGDISFSIYRGDNGPEHAIAYATYDSRDGGMCRSGFGPVKTCDPETEEGDDAPADEPIVENPPPSQPSGVDDGSETTPEPEPVRPPLAQIVNPTDFKPAPITSGLACKDGSKIVSEANNSGATSVNLLFEWNPVAGATKYDVHLTPLQPGGSKRSFKTTTTQTNVSFPMPRPKTKWGNPVAGEDTSYYGQYSMRVLPHVGGKSGDPQYTTVQYEHWSINCWGNVTFDNQRPPLPMFNPYSLDYAIDKHDSKTSEGYADVTFRWTGVEGAQRYRVSVFSTDTNKKWGADQYVSDTELTVRWPRKQLDQYGNPLGGQNADFYDTYWVRIQPLGTEWDGDARYRMFRYYHHDQQLHAPDGYY